MSENSRLSPGAVRDVFADAHDHQNRFMIALPDGDKMADEILMKMAEGIRARDPFFYYRNMDTGSMALVAATPESLEVYEQTAREYTVSAIRCVNLHAMQILSAPAFSDRHWALLNDPVMKRAYESGNLNTNERFFLLEVRAQTVTPIAWAEEGALHNPEYSPTQKYKLH